MVAWLRKHWPWLAGVLVAAAAFFSQLSKLSVQRKVEQQRKRVGQLREEGAKAEARYEQRQREAKSDSEIAARADRELAELKRQINKTVLPFILIGALLLGLWSFGGVAQAAEAPAAEPSLAEKYQQALDLIAVLVAQRDKAVELADTYKALYEREKERREQADADFLAAREREKELLQIIESQWQTILKLSNRSGFGVEVGVLFDPINGLNALREPKIYVGLSKTF